MSNGESLKALQSSVYDFTSSGYQFGSHYMIYIISLAVVLTFSNREKLSKGYMYMG